MEENTTTVSETETTTTLSTTPDNVDDAVKNMSIDDGSDDVNNNNSDNDKNNTAAGTVDKESNDVSCSDGTSTILASDDDDDDDDDDKTEGDDDNNNNNKDDDNNNHNNDETVGSTVEADTLLLQAVHYKEDGNNHFKVNDYEKAATSYRRGVSAIKKLNKNNTGDEQVKFLLVQLQTNFSMVRYKQGKYKVSVDLATRAISIDPLYVKALYWRAVSYRKLGQSDLAKIDLRTVLTIEPTNIACKKELNSIKKELEQSKEHQKRALAKAFASTNSSSFLYTDKEEEEKRKEQLALQKKQAEHELYKKRKAAWEDECVKRMSQNEKVESFEEYEQRLKDQEEEEKEKEKKKLEEKKRKEAKNASIQRRKETRSNNNNNNNKDDDDDDKLTEKELASMRGYKKTADGRTTSYFTRDVPDDLKRTLVQAPQRLDSISIDSADNSTSTGGPNLMSSMSSSGPTIVQQQQQQQQQQSSANVLSSSTAAGPSAWNQAQTWEEKDTTEWCKAKLKERLQHVHVLAIQDLLDGYIKSIDELTGDASVAIVAGGKKRYIYDFHCKLTYEIKMSNKTNTNTNDDEDDDNNNNTSGNVVATGVVNVPDICTGTDLDVSFTTKWKKSPNPSNLLDTCLLVRDKLAIELRTQVQCWIQDFNNQY